MADETARFIEIRTSEETMLIRPSVIDAVFAYQDGIDPMAKSWIKLSDNSQLKSTDTVQEIKELMLRCND